MINKYKNSYRSTIKRKRKRNKERKEKRFWLHQPYNALIPLMSPDSKVLLFVSPLDA